MLASRALTSLLAMTASAAVASGVTPQARGAGGCSASGNVPHVATVASTPPSQARTTTVDLCLTVPKGQVVGSLRATIVFDSAVATVTSAIPTRSGGIAVNARKAGRVELAIAAPSGVPSGRLLRLTIKLATPGRMPAMRLDLSEISNGKGISLGQTTKVTSYGVPECVEHAESGVYLTGLSPTSAEAGAIAELEITGCGFESKNNTVRFGDLVLDRIASKDARHIRIGVPTEHRGRGEVAPMTMTPGSYPIVVKTPRGSSNALVFTLR